MTWLSFVAIEIFSLSSLTLLQQFMLFCEILSLAILNLCCDRIFIVVTMFLLVSWIFCHDKLFLCRDSVFFPCIAETEICVTTDSFHVVTESSLLLVVR